MPRSNSEDSPKTTDGGKRRAARSVEKTPASVGRQGDLFEPEAPPKRRRIKRIAEVEPSGEAPLVDVDSFTPPTPKPRAPRKKAVKAAAPIHFPYKSVIALTYVGLVLVYDALATHPDLRTIDWAVFQWRFADVHALLIGVVPEALIRWMRWRLWVQFDLFKLVMWLLVPAAACIWWMDWDYFTRRRVKPMDWMILFGLCVVGFSAVAVSRFIPSVAAYYPGLAHGGLENRVIYAAAWGCWIISWLPAWEFMHRYFLLRIVTRDFPRFGWIALPLAEGLYHLQKPLWEAIGMTVFSIILTQYTLRRQNIVVPFLAHLFVELSLLLMMIL